MVGDTHTQVDLAYGPINSGAGAQTNYYLSARLKALGAREIDVPYLTELRGQFVPPPGYPRVREMLDQAGGFAVLCGRRGSGRETAARMTLCPPDGEPITTAVQEMRAEPSDGDAGLVLDPTQIVDGGHLLVNLSELSPTEFNASWRELGGVIGRCAEAQAELVVVIVKDQYDYLHDDLRRRCVWLEEPDPVLVVRRHLAIAGADLDDGAVVEEIREFAGGASMRELADLARDALDQHRRGDELPVSLGMALERASGYSKQVEALLQNRSDGGGRAWILALTAFEGAPVPAIRAARRKLVEHVGLPSGTHWLEEQPLTGLDELNLSVGPDRRMRFTRVGFGKAVLTRCWQDYYPDRHHELTEWMHAVIAGDELTDAEREEASLRLADQLLWSGHVQALLGVVEKSSTASDPVVLASTLLAEGVLDERCGRQVRRGLYDWAGRRELPVQLAGVVIGTCEHMLVAAYPSQAIVRLRHLTFHSAELVRANARRALRHLFEQDWLHRLAIAVYARGARVDWELFPDVVAPERLFAGRWPLTSESSLRARVIDCWRAALSELNHEEWLEPVHIWLSYAASTGSMEPLDVLVRAADRRAAALTRLYLISRDWAADGDARSATMHAELLARVNEAQGIQIGWQGGAR